MSESSMSRSVPTLSPELQTWLRKDRRRSLLQTLLAPLWNVIYRRGQWRRLLVLWGLYRERAARDHLWIHAVGPGQMKVAIALVQALPEDLPVVITSYEPGHRLARAALGGRAELTRLPLFFGPAVRGFFRRYSPRQLVLVEATDLRPLLCLHALGRELPTALVNGWFNRQWLGSDPFLGLLDRVQRFAVRDEGDRELLAGIGIPRERVAVAGEMKWDATAAPPLRELESRMLELAAERPILVAGSIHLPEVPQILDAFERLGGGGRALLVIAPRQLGSAQAMEELVRERGIEGVRRSRFPVSGRPAVVLLDSEGELAALYRVAAAAFVGDSLVPGGGGHNPVEPACCAVPVAVGPHMANFQLLAELFDHAGAWQRVADAGELARVWAAWLDAPGIARQIGRRAADLVASQRGVALSSTLALLRPFLGLEEHAATPSIRYGERS